MLLPVLLPPHRVVRLHRVSCLQLRDDHEYAQRTALQNERTHISYTFEEAEGGPRDKFPRGEHICPSEPVQGERLPS